MRRHCTWIFRTTNEESSWTSPNNAGLQNEGIISCVFIKYALCGNKQLWRISQHQWVTTWTSAGLSGKRINTLLSMPIFSMPEPMMVYFSAIIMEIHGRLSLLLPENIYSMLYSAWNNIISRALTGAFSSADNGKTWDTVNIDNMSVSSIVSTESSVVISTLGKGILKSTDNGITWNPVSFAPFCECTVCLWVMDFCGDIVCGNVS
ncbi:MAG: hypothetical protein IPK11_12740 [Ignavibacteria bacterium]|nr:hypothetical protein [Ignavibacteria bacterium]